MNVGLTIHSYALPLVCPLQLGGEELTHRTGWLIELTGPDGNKGWGDVAPLPGMSPDSELEAMEEWDGERVDSSMITPSVRCGLDMAFYNLGDPALMPAPLQALSPPRSTITLNALLIGTIDEMVKQELVAGRDGYDTIKIKVGRQDPAEEIQLLQMINNHAADHVKFRLDANRAWTPDTADRYLSVLSEMNIEYVEEPFQNPRASFAWSQGTGVPVALDESLRTMELDDLDTYAGLRAVVLKPTLLGGLVQSLEWAGKAREIGAYPVISSMMESGVGTLTLARFAASICDADVAVGLDTYRWLAEDVLDPAPVLKGAQWDAAAWDLSQYTVKVG